MNFKIYDPQFAMLHDVPYVLWNDGGGWKNDKVQEHKLYVYLDLLKLHQCTQNMLNSKFRMPDVYVEGRIAEVIHGLSFVPRVQALYCQDINHRGIAYRAIVRDVENAKYSWSLPVHVEHHGRTAKFHVDLPEGEFSFAWQLPEDPPKQVVDVDLPTAPSEAS